MQRVILLTEEEYTQLKSETPSALMQATIDKLKQSNETMQRQIFTLQAELQTYQLAGANKRPALDDYKTRFIAKYSKLIETYNAVATDRIKDSLIKTYEITKIPAAEIKAILKEGTDNKIIQRLNDNTYRYMS